MLWVVYPDQENTDYDMYDGAIIKADTKEEVENIATRNFNYERIGTRVFDTKQKWTAEKIYIETLENGVFFTSYRAG